MGKVNKIKNQEILRQIFNSLIWESFLGTLFEENGFKIFEGELKNGEYWNGKCKNK